MSAGPPLISLIVAMAQNGVIGRDNSLPWRLPEDLKRFRAYTLGKPILMGRKTFESLGRPLPGRTNLVLTRARSWSADGVIVVHSVEEALMQAASSDELVVIGGAEIYRLILPVARRIYLTHVHADVPGDITFPEFDSTQWADVECSSQPADDEHAYPLTFVTLERRNAPEVPRQH
ncbi:MAG: dihydrofolate reductase [Gammaproteobacteria bacterium]|nr:dihydrofolate reductase [Gammaproteobacteria bacterium]